MTLQQFLIILWARRRVALGLLALTVFATLLASLGMPKSYTATAKLVINYRATDPISGTTAPDLLMPTYLATQAEIIRSHSVALKVVDDLGLASDPATIQAFAETTAGNGGLRERLAYILSNRLNVKTSPEGATIDLSYQGEDPESAAALANAFADAYIQTSVRLNIEPARRTAEWFGEQVKALRDNLVKAQQNLADYQHAKGIVSLDERLDVESTRLAELSNQLVLAQAQTFDVSSKQKQIYSGKRLDQLDNDVGSAMKREASIRAALERQKALVMEVNQQREELGMLQGDVATAQKVLDLTMQRFSQTSMAGQASQSEAVVLDRATPPLEPSRPKVLRNLAISIFLGTMLAVGGALLAEMHDRRIHEPEDLSLGLNVPVLAVVAWPRGAHRRSPGWRGRASWRK